MAKFRKKPVIIDAIQFKSDGPDNHYDVMEFMGCTNDVFDNTTTPRSVIIRTLEGDMRAASGDWIIRGVKGEFYPCKPDIFAATYEALP